RHVDGLEDPGVALGARPQEAALHPALDMDRGEPAVHAQQVVEARHVNCSIALRGSWARPASHFSRNSFKAASGWSGRTTLSLTYWSPRCFDLRSGRPRPLRRSDAPVLEPAG